MSIFDINNPLKYSVIVNKDYYMSGVFTKTKVLLIITCVGTFFVFGYIYKNTNNSSKGVIDIQSKNIYNQELVIDQKIEKQNKDLKLIFVGDIMLSRNVNKKIEKHNIYYPFEKTKEITKTGDIVFANLENPITDGSEVKTGDMIFHANPGVEVGIKDAGFSVVSLANNHIPNYGTKGIDDTVTYLDIQGISHVGAGKNEEEAQKPVIIEKNGLKIGFLGYNDTDVIPLLYKATPQHAGTNIMNIDNLKKDITKLKKEDKIDFVIVSMHSGTEYTEKPNKSQILFAHTAIDTGADLVIGHHPHVVQTLEKYNNKYIFYSLGNFIFDQMWSDDTRRGLLLEMIINKSGILKIEPKPVIIEDYSQPRIADEIEAAPILSRLQYSINDDPTFVKKLPIIE